MPRVSRAVIGEFLTAERNSYQSDSIGPLDFFFEQHGDRAPQWMWDEYHRVVYNIGQRGGDIGLPDTVYTLVGIGQQDPETGEYEDYATIKTTDAQVKGLEGIRAEVESVFEMWQEDEYKGEGQSFTIVQLVWRTA